MSRNFKIVVLFIIRKVGDTLMYSYEEIRDALAAKSKPCAFLHVESLEKNIESILQMSGDKMIRIASKSIRSVEVLKMIKSYSKRFQGVMCFTADEAIYLHEKGLDDLFIAYPTWDEDQLKKICQLVQYGKTIIVTVDSEEHIDRLEQIAQSENGHFLVAVDIDLSTKFPGLHFGVYRSPLQSVDDVIRLIKRINSSPYVKLDGLIGYEAQIAGVVDHAPKQRMKNYVVRFLKKRSLHEIKQKRSEIMKALNKEGITIRFFNGGGTGSMHTTKEEDVVTEITVGSGFYNSHLFDKYSAFQLSPAVGFAVEITRKPKEHMYTCLGGGYVASGAVGDDKLPEIHLPKRAKLTKNEAAGEVQTPVIYDGPISLNIGDPIIFRHSKAGELCERFNYLHIIKNNRIVDQFTTYRGDGKCFL